MSDRRRGSRPRRDERREYDSRREGRTRGDRFDNDDRGRHRSTKDEETHDDNRDRERDDSQRHSYERDDRRGRHSERHHERGGRDRSRSRHNRRGSRRQEQPGRHHPIRPLDRRELIRNGLLVKTNLFQLRFLHQTPKVTWYKYYIQIHRVFRQKDENGNILKDEHGKDLWRFSNKSMFYETDTPVDQLSETEKLLMDKTNRSSHLSRRILLKFQEQYRLGHLLVTDGTNLAYSSQRLDGFTTKRAAQEPAAGSYGPQDTTGKKPSKPSRIFEDPVRVKLKSDEDGTTDAKGSEYGNFMVKLTQLDPVKMRITLNQDGSHCIKTSDSGEICQALQLSLNMAMMERLIALSRSPRAYFFKPRNDPLANLARQNPRFRFDPQCSNLTGLVQSARIAANGGACFAADFCIGWCKQQEDLQGRRIPLLDPNRKTLAGVHLDSFDRPINRNKRGEVVQALELETFDCIYVKGVVWKDRFKEKIKKNPPKKLKGLTPEQIRQKIDDWAVESKKNLRMVQLRHINEDDPIQDNIVWAANDPTLHSFEVADCEGNVTVEEYFRIRYGIRLLYPCMPLVRVKNSAGRDELLPVEFLFQSFGPAAKGNNQRKLDYGLYVSDQVACGARIQQVERMLSREEMSGLTQRLSALGLQMETTSLTTQAKILEEPTLEAGNRRKLAVKNGSWNLTDCKFKVPAKMHSFAVINLCGRSCPENLPREIFDALQRKGVKLPFENVDRQRLWQSVEATGSGESVDENGGINPAILRKFFREATRKAKSLFMEEAHSHGACFFTIARVKYGQSLEAHEVAVLPNRLTTKPPTPDEGYGVVRIDSFAYHPTHRIMLNSGQQRYATLKYRIYYSDRVGILDVNLVRWTGFAVEFYYEPDQRWMALTSRDSLEPIFREYVPPQGLDQQREPDSWTAGELLAFEPAEQFQVRFPEGESRTMKSTSIINNPNDIECPSIVYVLFPKVSPGAYSMAKWMGPNEFQVNTQVMTMESFRRQRNPGNYCEALASKDNAKLSTLSSLGKANAWSSLSASVDSWIREKPTMIVGLSAVAAQGQSSDMIVTGVAWLDVLNGGQNCCFEPRAQTDKSHLINANVIKSIFKNLITQFVRYNYCLPERIVVYRSGVHDGIFENIRINEIRAIRTACKELKREKDPDQPCSNKNCPGDCGCQVCCPLITYSVAQTSNIRLAPANPGQVQGPRNVSADKVNVPSGTCVDNADMLLTPYSLEAMNREINENRLQKKLHEFHADHNILSQDFLLVPHGGLKGTSKCVQYRIVLNENYYFKPLGSRGTQLTKAILQQLTYDLSFIYPKATKAPREMTLLRLGWQLSNTLLGAMSFMGEREVSNFLDGGRGDGTGNEPGFRRMKVSFRGNEEWWSDSLLPCYSPYASGPLTQADPFRHHVVA